MKILIATGLYPPDIGGPATMLAALANSLKERGCEVKIITYAAGRGSDKKNIEESGMVNGLDSRLGSIKLTTGRGNDKKENGNDKERHESEDIEIYRFSKKGNKLYYRLRYLLKMAVLSGWADVVYVTDTYSVGYFAYLIKKLTGKKYIVRFAGDSAWEAAVSRKWTTDYIVDFQEKKYGQKIEKLKERRRAILTGADKVIAVSDFLARIAEKIGVSREKIKVIYNSIDFANWHKDEGEIERIRNQYAGTGKIIVTACRLVSWKGVGGIIKILPALKQEVGEVTFLVLGEGPETDDLKKLAENEGVGNSVHFLGRIEHKKILNYFRAADLFILNTNYEGLSHTLLEAMRAGVPIVTTGVGGNPEVIEDGKDGLLVEYNNLEKLSDAAMRVLTDSALSGRLTENAGEKLKKFNWESVVTETIKIIKDLTNE